MQIYNFESDEKTHKPDGTVDYEIVKLGAAKNDPVQKVFEFSEDVKGLQGGGASQGVIQKKLPLTDLEPGQYKLTVKATDKLRSPNQTTSKSETFTVN